MWELMAYRMSSDAEKIKMLKPRMKELKKEIKHEQRVLKNMEAESERLKKAIEDKK